MLIKAQQWIKQAFVVGSQPSINTVKKWHKNGEIDGALLGGTLYIEVEGGVAGIGAEPIKRKWSIK